MTTTMPRLKSRSFPLFKDVYDGRKREMGSRLMASSVEKTGRGEEGNDILMADGWRWRRPRRRLLLWWREEERKRGFRLEGELILPISVPSAGYDNGLDERSTILCRNLSQENRTSHRPPATHSSGAVSSAAQHSCSSPTPTTRLPSSPPELQKQNRTMYYWNRKAVESYWRSELVNDVTADEDKVAPAHKLEELCKYLQSAHAGIGKEVSDFIIKRLHHKSPIVKQKHDEDCRLVGLASLVFELAYFRALRLIKYLMGKLGVDFKREMQRSSAMIHKLCHYKGQLDPLKGDSLNKAIRDSANEVISAIFDEAESNAPVLAENISKRIQGFGSKDFEMQTGVKKSFLSQLVDLVSTSISLGESTIATSHSLRNNDNESYNSQMDGDGSDRHDDGEQTLDVWLPSVVPETQVAEHWDQDSSADKADNTSGVSISGHAREMSLEDRLLETMITSGGVRLQPARDALQVRMKAMCILESILRKRDGVHYSAIASYFMENEYTVLECLKSPQASLRKKATIVLSLLDKKQTAEKVGHSVKPPAAKAETDTVIQIFSSTISGGIDDHGTDDSKKHRVSPSTGPIVSDQFGDNLNGSSNANEDEDDPFADVSFHAIEERTR
ncbi:hypothetical protein ACLOJK_021156 [Asimina triloba]